MMPPMRFYADDGPASRQVEKALNKKGVDYIKVYGSRECTAPTIATVNGYYEGTAEIELYLCLEID